MRVSNKLPAIQRCVDQLENAGFKIRVRYEPKAIGVFSGKPYHGLTTVEFSRHNFRISVGHAYCTLKDQFDRSQGTRFAFNRAVHELTEKAGREYVKNILR